MNRSQMRLYVIARDRQCCQRCGTQLRDSDSVSVHHRQLRSQGGPECACNLLLLCGSGTTGCHGWTHANVRAARELGLLVSAYADTRAVLVNGATLLCNTEH